MIYDKLAMYYDQFVDHDLYNKYLELITEHFVEGSVLDLGCGTGPLAIKLAKEGFIVNASDISKSMLERAYNNSVHENVSINFFIHDILNPINIDSDIITMSSDVINYFEDAQKVIKVFKHISEIMKNSSIFIFDFLKEEYLQNLVGYEETIKLDDSIIHWEVKETGVVNQVKHIVKIGDYEEAHTQTTLSEDKYIKLLEQSNLIITKRITLEDRVIVVCMKLRRKV